jgi:hypothetical protein
MSIIDVVRRKRKMELLRLEKWENQTRGKYRGLPSNVHSHRDSKKNFKRSCLSCLFGGCPGGRPRLRYESRSDTSYKLVKTLRSQRLSTPQVHNFFLRAGTSIGTILIDTITQGGHIPSWKSKKSNPFTPASYHGTSASWKTDHQSESNG